jgi:hypothetical protein
MLFKKRREKLELINFDFDSKCRPKQNILKHLNWPSFGLMINRATDVYVIITFSPLLYFFSKDKVLVKFDLKWLPMVY